MMKDMLFCIVCLWLEFICIQDFYLEKVFLEKKNRKEKKKKRKPPPNPPFPGPARAQPRPQRALPSLLAATDSRAPPLSLSDAWAPHVSRRRFFLPCRSRAGLWQPKEIFLPIPLWPGYAYPYKASSLPRGSFFASN